MLCIIVVCMVEMFCEFWEAWLTWNSDAQIPFMSNPSKNNMQLRLIAMSWIFNESIDTSTFSYPEILDDPTFLSANEHAKSTCESEKEGSKHTFIDSMDEEKLEHVKLQNVEKRILAELPEGYVYKMLRVENYKHINSYNCSFKLELDSEESVKKWVTAYNEKSKETMVYDTCRSGKGKKL